MGYKVHCISCGESWGSGKDMGSSGVCPKCFKLWINGKRRTKGLKECYGKFNMEVDIDCNKCTVARLCYKDTYGVE